MHHDTADLVQVSAPVPASASVPPPFLNPLHAMPVSPFGGDTVSALRYGDDAVASPVFSGDTVTTADKLHEMRTHLEAMRHTLMQMRHLSDMASWVALRQTAERQLTWMLRRAEELAGSPSTGLTTHGATNSATASATAGAAALCPERERFELGLLLYDAADLCRPHFDLRQQRLRIDLPSAPLEIDGLPGALTDAFAQLLQHTAQTTPPGRQVRLHLRRDGLDAVVCLHEAMRATSASTSASTPAATSSSVSPVPASPSGPAPTRSAGVEPPSTGRHRASARRGLAPMTDGPAPASSRALQALQRCLGLHGGTVQSLADVDAGAPHYTIRLPLAL